MSEILWGDILKIFIDSAKTDEIKKFSFLIDGVTTNPSLIKAAMNSGMDMEEYIKEICRIVGKDKSVSLEVISLDRDGMVKEAQLLYEKFNTYDNVAIKIPVSTSTDENNQYEGLTTIKTLSEKGIRVNATLIMTPEQALLAAKMGATFVSPFAGRVDDLIRGRLGLKFEKGDYFPAGGIFRGDEVVTDNGICSGVDLVRKIVDIFNKYKIRTEVIAASLRNARQVREVAEVGAQISTIPFNVLNNMINHPKTREGIIKFSEDVVEEYRNVFR